MGPIGRMGPMGPIKESALICPPKADKSGEAGLWIRKKRIKKS